MSRDFGNETLKGLIVAGSGDLQRAFYVSTSALKKSPVIKGWIEEPTSLPSSLCKDGALIFLTVSPDVMGAVVKYLESHKREPWTFSSGGNSAKTLKTSADYIFYVRLYKLALSLALESLCTAALHQIQAKKPTIEIFLDIVVEAKKGNVSDGREFRKWILGYMNQNSEQLAESKIFRDAVEGGGIKAWAMCSVLMKGLEDSDFDSAGNTRSATLRKENSSTPLPSSSKKNPNKILTTPSRQSAAYSAIFNRSPASSTSATQVAEKPPAEGLKRRRYNATVHDGSIFKGEKLNLWLSEDEASPKRIHR